MKRKILGSGRPRAEKARFAHIGASARDASGGRQKTHGVEKNGGCSSPHGTIHLIGRLVDAQDPAPAAG
jgi:hypothetical protein